MNHGSLPEGGLFHRFKSWASMVHCTGTLNGVVFTVHSNGRVVVRDLARTGLRPNGRYI